MMNHFWSNLYQDTLVSLIVEYIEIEEHFWKFAEVISRAILLLYIKSNK